MYLKVLNRTLWIDKHLAIMHTSKFIQRRLVTPAKLKLYPISGSQFGQSKRPEVGGIWPEVGGKQLSIYLVFLINVSEN